jgi:uncharacterized protein (TIGR02118 family)
MALLTILYPAAHPFDVDYYLTRHMPLVKRLFSPFGLRSLTSIRPSVPSIYQLVAQLQFDRMEQLLAARANCSAEAQADIPNFTSASPVTLIGEEISH